ncbi:hypothetical protein CYMTET_53037 [Cymbomonas tetramitiformis]|uniref:Uncharacterized protein n=1 Tax=Cymbomonas tetramitiformis TaxID=36881 RepID=A0AAE0BJL7_9CHLO|nr:hypothetical protein CYMTET_53037 [Cymbomonas tetramitiformis]
MCSESAEKYIRGVHALFNEIIISKDDFESAKANAPARCLRTLPKESIICKLPKETDAETDAETEVAEGEPSEYLPSDTEEHNSRPDDEQTALEAMLELRKEAPNPVERKEEEEEESEAKWTVESNDIEHTTEIIKTNSKQRGIHHEFRDKIISHVDAVDVPQRILNQLNLTYRGQPAMLARLPAISQIQDFQRNMIRRATGATKFETVADLVELTDGLALNSTALSGDVNALCRSWKFVYCGWLILAFGTHHIYFDVKTYSLFVTSSAL